MTTSSTRAKRVTCEEFSNAASRRRAIPIGARLPAGCGPRHDRERMRSGSLRTGHRHRDEKSESRHSGISCYAKASRHVRPRGVSTTSPRHCPRSCTRHRYQTAAKRARSGRFVPCTRLSHSTDTAPRWLAPGRWWWQLPRFRPSGQGDGADRYERRRAEALTSVLHRVDVDGDHRQGGSGPEDLPSP
jgi:hypothetical protein